MNEDIQFQIECLSTELVDADAEVWMGYEESSG